MEEQKPDISFIKRQRMSAMWNGVIIGIGVGTFMSAGPGALFLALIPLGLGIGVEWMQRKRLSREKQ
ncbi:MAG: hypothetical protein O2783_07400 [Chloroflexi bacterium]|nr:hypothetical protein [Chloroflexota bacterium]